MALEFNVREYENMKKPVVIAGRCISLWHSHRLNGAHSPYSLDMVLQDSQNSWIQIYIKKEWMFWLEPLFKEGQYYFISNFAIPKNSDVIGSVLVIGDVVPVQSAAGRKIRRTVVIEDSEYKVIMRIIDQSGSAHIVFFNTMINKLLGYTAWELMERHGMNVDEMSLNRVLEMPPPSIEMGASGSGSVSGSKVNNFTDNSLNRVLKMRTPSTEIRASGSTLGSSKKRVFIDLDEINSEDEVEGTKNELLNSKKTFGKQDSEDDFTTPANKINVNNFTDDSLNRASGSASGCGRKRVFIGLDEIDSVDEVEGCNSSNIQKIVRVKVVKEDP
nr:hypothetical protein [Tanacetum cinerariifolium]